MYSYLYPLEYIVSYNYLIYKPLKILLSIFLFHAETTYFCIKIDMVMDSIEKKIEEVCQRVCDYFGIKYVERIYTPSKTNATEKLATARSYALYILHRDEKVTINRLSAKFRRTPRTIYWHVRKMEDMLKWYEKERKIYEEICR